MSDGIENSGSEKLRQVHAQIHNINYSETEIQIDQIAIQSMN